MVLDAGKQFVSGVPKKDFNVMHIWAGARALARTPVKFLWLHLWHLYVEKHSAWAFIHLF